MLVVFVTTLPVILATFVTHNHIKNPYLFNGFFKIVPYTIASFLMFAFADHLSAYLHFLDFVIESEPEVYEGGDEEE